MSSNIGRGPKEYIAEKVKTGVLGKADGKILLDFINDRTTTKNIMPHTEASYARYLSVALGLIKKPIKDWDYNTFTDFSTVVKAKYQANTHRKHIGTMKVFVLYLIEMGIVSSIRKEQIERVGLPKPNRMTKKAGDMLSVDEVKKIIGGAKNSRDRALLAIAFESGCRPIELMELEWEDVNFDKYGATLNTAKKTGKPRRIRIINMAGHLKSWKNDYPGEPSGKNPVFVNLDTVKDHHAITRGALKKILAKAVANSGIQGKRIHMYLFRHSRVTNMLAEGIPTSVIGLQMWGSLDSTMMKTYGHLSDVQTDTILLAHAGITESKKMVSQSKPVACPSCASINTAGLKYCGVCGAVLDPEEYQRSLSQAEQERAAILAVGRQYISAQDIEKLVLKAVQDALAAKK